MERRVSTQKPAASDDTVLVVSPDSNLVKEVESFSAANNLTLWIGRPKSPDVIAVPYKIAIVDKAWLGEEAWTDWIGFLKETKNDQHHHLLLIIVRPPTVNLIQEAMSQFGRTHEPVCFLGESSSSDVVKIMKAWLETGILLGCRRPDA
jgi:hypothetical protein